MPTLRRSIKFPVFLPVNELTKSDSDFLQIRRPTAFAAEPSLSFVHAIARCASDDRGPDQKRNLSGTGELHDEAFNGLRERAAAATR